MRACSGPIPSRGMSWVHHAGWERGDAEAMVLVRIAEVLRRAGNVTDAREALRQALTLYEQKGVTLSVEQTRVALARLAAT